MADKYDAPYWSSQIQAAKKYRQNYASSDLWSTWRNYYEGNWGTLHDGIMGGSKAILPINLIFAHGRKYVSSLVSSFPSVVAKPLGAGLGPIAMIVEQVGRMFFTSLPLVENVRRAVQDAFITGTGILRRGYGSQFGYFPMLGEGKTDAKGQVIEFGEQYEKGMPWGLWHQVEDTLVPWGVVRDEDVWWQSFRMYRRVEDLKADTRFKDTKNLVGVARPITEKSDTHLEEGQYDLPLAFGEEGNEPSAEWLGYWEIHDYRRNKLICLVEGQDLIILEETDVLASTGHRLGYSIRLNDNNRCWWGISDVKNIEPQQLEANDIRTQAMYSRRAAILRILIRKNAISRVNIAKMASGVPNVIVEVEGDPNTVVKDLHPAIPLDLIPMMEEVRKDIRDMIGLSRNQQGAYAGARTTATEVGIVGAASEENMDDRRNVVNRVLASLLQGMLDSAMRFWTTPKTVAIVGPDGLPYWIEFKGSEIQGKFRIDVDVNAGIPYTQQLRRMEMQGLIGTMGAMAPEMITPEFMKYYLATFPYLDKASMFKPRPGVGGSPESPMDTRQFGGAMNRLKKGEQGANL